MNFIKIFKNKWIYNMHSKFSVYMYKNVTKFPVKQTNFVNIIS